MGVCGYKIDPRALLTSPNVILRGVSVGGMTYAAYKRHISIQSYNQYADDVTEASRDPHADEAIGGYIDYFNRSPTAVQAGFDASATMDDELIADEQHRAGDTVLLTS
ncbi:unnamed protein product [Taenia asiatica]|uniref:Peptidase_S8 domain-containing protein n=1 Tax=Taenia asiatica TaxID=60517 RepID=A0A0R3WEW6_TAEAS|nr:unnamed protein product [Taenia asiatica]